jgi:hypothetical protein
MSIQSFTAGVYDASQFSPSPLNVSLSGASNEVVLDAAGTVGSKQLVGILYNSNSVTLLSTLVSLSSSLGNSFRVDQAFHGSQMAFAFSDNTSSLFTVNTAIGTSNQQALSAANSEQVGPETRRKYVLGYV